MLPGVCGIHLAAPAFAQFFLDILDKTPLLLVIQSSDRFAGLVTVNTVRLRVLRLSIFPA